MTREQWYKDPENYRQLAEALKTPIIKQAISLLKDENEPEATEGTNTNVTYTVSKFHHGAGFYGALRSLRELSEPQKETKRKQPVLPSLLRDVIDENSKPK